MDDPHSSQDGVPKSKFTYRHLNALSSSTPPKDSPLRYARDTQGGIEVILGVWY